MIYIGKCPDYYSNIFYIKHKSKFKQLYRVVKHVKEYKIGDIYKIKARPLHDCLKCKHSFRQMLGQVCNYHYENIYR